MAGVIKPAKLGPGSRIAVIAPAGPPNPERLKEGLRFLRNRGYKPEVYPQVRRKLGYLAGADKSRADAINDAFADPEIDAIFAARGGYGTLRLLPLIDFGLIKSNPKVILGYSDLTVLLLALYAKCKFVTFHGPMVAIDFFGRPFKYTVDHCFKSLECAIPQGKIKIPEEYKLVKIRGGIADGSIVGGNLALIARMIGTGFLPSFKNKVVFLEDTEEEPYRLDAYLAQLFMATDLGDAAGYLIGEITRTEARYGRKNTWSALDVMRDYFRHLDKPVLYNYPCGHGDKKITIPIGINVHLNADRKFLEFKEAGVS